jgi:hypothetical protein
MLTGSADLRTAMDAINEAAIFRFYTKPAGTALLVEGIQQALTDRPMASAAPGHSAQDGGMIHIGITAINDLNVGVIVRDSVCRAHLVEETSALHSLVRVACDDGDDFDMPALSLSRPSGKKPLAVVALLIKKT